MLTWISNQKNSTKLMAGFAVVGVILAVVGVVGVSSMSTINLGAKSIYETNLIPIKILAEIRGRTHQVRGTTIQHIAAPTAEEKAEMETVLKTLEGEIAERWPLYESLITSAVEKEFYAKYRSAWDDYRKARDMQTLLLSREGKDKQAYQVMKTEVAPKYKLVVEYLNALIQDNEKQAKENFEQGQQVYQASRNMLIGLIAGGIVSGLLLGWMIARFLSRSLNDVVTAAQALGRGDLTSRSSVTTQDEVGMLAQAFNNMGGALQAAAAEQQEVAAAAQVVAEEKISEMQKLTTTLMAVRSAAESVTTGAEQITKGNEDLSQRTSEQASSLEETSSAMEQMTSTVKQNADNAKQANQLAIAARDVAEQGGAVTTKAIEAMDEINKSSKKIADIITVIDEIAFQTNLLALNAAVEVARAGEHGRGFAVVAAEVRNLAQRSATAAKEIKGLINESVQRVTDGSELVDQSGKTLAEIVGSVKRVTDIIAEITAASQEQASGIDQVNKAIMQMDETTQQNAALVEEATSASQSMKEQAKALMDLVASFKMEGSGAESQARPGAATQKPSAQSAGSMKKPLFKKPSAPKPVAVGAGAAHKQKDEFEEF